MGDGHTRGDRRPAISAVITTFNQARFIGRTIESVLGQTRAPDEVVVVDDGSADDTPLEVERFGSRVRLIRQANRGVAGARNRGVAEAKGDLVALLDGDDEWLPTKLECCHAALRVLPQTLVMVHDVELVSMEGTPVSAWTPVEAAFGTGDHAASPRSIGCWDSLLERNFVVTTAQVLVSRDLYVEAGESNSRFRIASDYDLYLRLAERVAFTILPAVLARWTQHDASASGAGRDQRMMNWGSDVAEVLRYRAGQTTAGRATALRAAARREIRQIVRELYMREDRDGSLTTARALWGVGARFRSGTAILAAAAVLMPPRMRRLGSALIGSRFWYDHG
ncbi:MAG: glycosyltransferase [Acidimicrobiia bacterium]|nr:glycosyltransferase [Acidimicrobiia bacterium]